MATGELLFWVESALASVVYTALVMALLARLKKISLPWLRRIVIALTFIHSTCLFVVGYYFVLHMSQSDDVALMASVVGVCCFVIFVVAFCLLGRKKHDSTWRLLRVSRVLGALFLLDFMIVPWLLFIGVFVAAYSFSQAGRFSLICSCILFGLVILASVMVILRSCRDRALAWSLPRLLLAFVASVLLCVMTFWNLSLSVQQEVARVSVRAGALAAIAMPAKLPDSQNAALIYNRARKILEADDSGGWNMISKWHKPEDGKKTFDPENAEMLAFLDSNSYAIGLLHEAAKLPGCDFGCEYSLTYFNTIIDHMGPGRTLVWLLSLSARVNAAKGNPAAALADLEAGFVMAGHYIKEPTLIGVLVSASMNSTCVDTLEDLFGQHLLVDADLDKLFIESSLDYRNSGVNAMKMEQAMQMAIYADDSILDFWNGSDFTCIIPNGYLFSNLYRVFFFREDVGSANRHFQSLQESFAKPYHESYEQWKQLDDDLYRKPTGPLARIIMPGLSRAGILFSRGNAKRRLAILAIAMERYRREHGQYPQDFDALNLPPGYDTRIDPFTGKDMLIGTNADGRTVLYSTGADQKDNGGRKPGKKEGRFDDGVDIVFELPY